MAFKSIDATTDVDPQPIADAVVDALGPDLVDAATVEASCETAIADKVADNSIPAKTTVTDVPGQVITELNTGSSTLSRAVASALQALVDAVAANTIPSDADVAAVPASTATALNTGSSTLSRVIASVVQGIADAVAANSIPSKTNVTDVPSQTIAALDANDTPLSVIVASVLHGLFAATTENEDGGVHTQFGPNVSVAGVATQDLTTTPSDPSYFVDLLGVLISTTGATTVGIGVTGEGTGAVFEHPFTGAQIVFIKADQFVFNGYGPIMRIYNKSFTVSGSAGGVTVHATPWYRTNEI